jgi:hypothetical protein
MPDPTLWPAWATAKVGDLTRADARSALTSAQSFWRDFASAGLTIEDLRAVIEERRRKGPGGRITIQPPLLTTIRTVPSLPRPDNSLFDTFPPLDPEDPRWIHA